MNNKQQSLKLKPCPFCGGKAAWGDGEQKTKYGNEQVYCTKCWCITAPEGSKEEAAANWNARATSLEPLSAQSEAMPVMDWQQVVLNGGPPCFAVGVTTPNQYCGRAERWAGHNSDHKFVSLDDLIRAAKQ